MLVTDTSRQGKASSGSCWPQRELHGTTLGAQTGDGFCVVGRGPERDAHEPQGVRCSQLLPLTDAGTTDIAKSWMIQRSNPLAPTEPTAMTIGLPSKAARWNARCATRRLVLNRKKSRGNSGAYYSESCPRYHTNLQIYSGYMGNGLYRPEW